jgi:aspartate/methionine/tyrosine aminotransferase
VTTPLANRVSNIESFKVMDLVLRAQALEAKGLPIIHLSIGEPDFGAPKTVLKGLHEALANGPMPYTSAKGLTALRQKVSHYYASRFGVDISAERIMITAGASGALTLACAALVNPGDHVLMSDPCYPCNRHFVAAFDGIAQTVPCGPAERFQLSAQAIEQNWLPTTRGVLLATPSNPTGTSIGFEELKRCLAITEQRDGFCIVDEIYLELSYGKQARSALELSDKIIVTNSFSKFFSMTGWRLGWLVAPTNWMPSLEKLAQNLYICPSTLAQHAALECFTEESLRVFDARKQEFENRRNYLVPELKRLGFNVPVEPDGAFYVYADVSAFGLTATEFAEKLLQQAHVSVVPGTDFGKFETERYIRISYANSLENIRAAIARIERFIQN